MKKFLILLLIAFSLAGCKTNDLNTYKDCISVFYNRNNYKIIENIDGEETLYEYSGTISHIKSKDEECYVTNEDDKTFIYALDQESKVFVKKEIDYNERYFYAYKIVERLNKIKYYVTNNMLVYKNSSFINKGELDGQYLYDGTVHKPLSIVINIEDGMIVAFEETYENAKKDYLQFMNYGTCNIELPKSYINYEDIKEADSN